jgi:hypothetical protein
MKKVWTYFAIGCVVAIIGMFFSDICGDFFNGMDYGSACVLGISAIRAAGGTQLHRASDGRHRSDAGLLGRTLAGASASSA